jgi:hypothetical protein
MAQFDDIQTVFAVPLEEGVAVDAQFLSHFGKTDVLGTKQDEFITDFVGIHSILDFGFYILDLMRDA